MNNICPFCNSEAKLAGGRLSQYNCKFCSEFMNFHIWWWAWWWADSADRIYFDSHDECVAEYYMQTQKLVIQREETFIIPPDKVIAKLKTILLLS